MDIPTFKPGDLVYCIAPWENNASIVGLSGVVIVGTFPGSDDLRVGVQYDKPIDRGHNASSRGADKRCWFTHPSCLVLAGATPEERLQLKYSNTRTV